MKPFKKLTALTLAISMAVLPASEIMASAIIGQTSVEEAEMNFLELQQEYLEEMDQYFDQYLILQQEGDKLQEKVLVETAKDAYEAGAEKKQKREKQWKNKLKKADAHNYRQWDTLKERKEEKNRRKKSKEAVCLEELGKEQEDTSILVLEEAVEPQEFMKFLSEELQESGASIQPDYKFELATVVEEEENVKKEVFLSEEETYSLQAEFEQAWNISTGDGITVAVIDTGIDISHPEIKDHVVDGYNFCADNTDVFDETNPLSQAHGTHIAGIIANSAPNAKIMPLKVFENGEAYTSDIIRAIEYAKEHGADIVNMSFGSAEDNLALEQAMEASEMFFVCAAGNRRKNISDEQVYPASYAMENIISVGALTQDGNLTYFSNYGEAVDIAALGKNIESAFPGGSYGTMSGTSMSAAYISAAAALTASATGTEGVKAALMDGADHISCLNEKIASGNRLNVTGAVNRIVQTEQIIVEKKEDEGYDTYPLSDKESWELFSATDNVKIESLYHTLVLKEDGTVWAWGANTAGCLGDGTMDDRYAPVQVVGLTNVVDIAVGVGCSYALKADGTVWAWGSNSVGQLGDAYSETSSTIPVKVLTEDDTKVIAIAAGAYSAMELKSDGSVWEWGSTYLHEEIGYPMKISQLSNVKKIFVGTNIGMVIKEDGSTWGWGNNELGQLGNGTTTEQKVPVQINELKNMTQIELGHGNWNFGINDNGTLWEWGNLLGVKISTPRKVSGMLNIRQVSTGYMHTAAVTNTGSLYVWGNNYAGQIGDGTEINRTAPVLVQLSTSVSTSFVAAGMETTIALASDDTIWTWGKNTKGQLGDGLSIGKRSTPTKIKFLPGLRSEEYYNTTFENALQINKDDLIADAIRSGGEYRYYKFVPKETANYEFGTISGQFDTYGYLYDANHTLLKSNDDGNKKGGSANARDFYIKYKLLKGDTYYIRIRSFYSYKMDNYDLFVRYYDDYGNKISAAGMLLFNTMTDGEIDYPADKDMYFFMVPATGLYNFETFSGIDTYGCLYDSKGKLLAQDDDSGSTYGRARDFHIQHLLYRGQNCYLSVNAFSKSTLGMYQLKVSYEDDYGKEFENAKDITGNYTTEGMIQYHGDADTFCFVPEESGTYYITTNGGDLQTKKTLYDASGVLLGESEEDENGIIRLTCELEAGNTYYIKTEYETADAMGTYTLYVEQPFEIMIE